MNATHTPTPWMTDGHGQVVTAEEHGQFAGMQVALCWNEGEAVNIVRRCNAHDDLVAALRGMLNARGPQSEQAWAILEHDARAALAKAGAA